MILLLASSVTLAAQAARLAPPPDGKLYHGFYWGGIGTDTHDPSEHDVTAEDVSRYEQTVGKRVTWVYFSDNWFESRRFPEEMCSWIRDLGKIPYVRLMLRSDVDQKHAEKQFTLHKIAGGEFDADLRAWAHEARSFGSPILIEWGTEPNGDWFGWNGKWNGRQRTGASDYIAAYRHIVDLMREEGASNLQWVWHVNWYDEPPAPWNRFEKYFPGDKYCDWVGLSAYGPTTPTMRDGAESFAFKLREAYPRLTRLAPGKPMIVAEFGCDLHNHRVKAAPWADQALQELFSQRWSAIVGFCWWNEGWQNDDHQKHDSDLIILHDHELTHVFQSELALHADKLQETPIIVGSDSEGGSRVPSAMTNH